MIFLGFLNFTVFQWFFFRLGYTDQFKTLDGKRRWGILFPVYPLTGWDITNSSYHPKDFEIYWLH